MEVNLENPIFVIYLGLINQSRQRVDEEVAKVNSHFGQIKNITFWIFVDHEKSTRVECIWQGSKYQLAPVKDSQNLIEHINSVLEILSEGTSDESLKAQLRDLQISKVID